MTRGVLGAIATAVAAVVSLAAFAPATGTTAQDFGASLVTAIESSGALAPRTTLQYSVVEPNGGLGGVWPQVETFTVNPDGSLVYRQSAHGVLEGREATLVTDLRCPPRSRSCWKRFPYEFKDQKWHRVPRSLVLYQSAYEDVMLFADGPWPAGDDYSITSAGGGAQTFTHRSPSGALESWTVTSGSIEYTDACTTCDASGNYVLFTEHYTSIAGAHAVPRPARRRIGSPGDRDGYSTMFSVVINR